jgi:hypothetical protein
MERAPSSRAMNGEKLRWPEPAASPSSLSFSGGSGGEWRDSSFAKPRVETTIDDQLVFCRTPPALSGE